MTKRALLIGINIYKNAPLKGCVNDVKRRLDTLVRPFGIDPKNIITLLDYDATTYNIKRALADIKAKSLAGDTVAFLYSGHGTHVASKKEADGYQEVICPVDFDWTPEHMVTDADFASFLNGLKGRFVGFFDSCHSAGSISVRDFDQNTSKYLINPDLPDYVDRRPSIPIMSVDDLLGGHVAFFGCNFNQTSADARIQGVACGAFSNYTEDALKQAGYVITNQDLIANIAYGLAHNGYSQVPQLQCHRNSLTELFMGGVK